MKKPITVYVGCALSNAPVSFQEKIIALKHEIRSLPHVTVLDFVSPHEEATPLSIWKHDCGCITKCDVFLAVADFPSLGLGAEINDALCVQHKPTLVVASQGIRVSRFVLGLIEAHPKISCFRSVSSWDQIIGHLRDFFVTYEALRKSPLDWVREQNPSFLQEAPIYITTD